MANTQGSSAPTPTLTNVLFASGGSGSATITSGNDGNLNVTVTESWTAGALSNPQVDVFITFGLAWQTTPTAAITNTATTGSIGAAFNIAQANNTTTLHFSYQTTHTTGTAASGTQSFNVSINRKVN